ncbi:hypothetical protein [Ekhidna sp.]|uniref:hypothetical protein n=1 Tax=Ekhidna sp. TaxID=2608089 RepID=UPI003297D79B
MMIIWYSRISNEYAYSTKTEFERISLTSLFNGEIVKVEEMKGIPDAILSKLVHEMNEHNNEPLHFRV